MAAPSQKFDKSLSELMKDDAVEAAWTRPALPRKRKLANCAGSDEGGSGTHVGEDGSRGGGGGRGVASTGSGCERVQPPFTAFGPTLFGGSRNVASPSRSARDNSLPEQSRNRRRSRSRRNSSSHSHPRTQVRTHPSTRSDAQYLANQSIIKCPLADRPEGCKFIGAGICVHLHRGEDLSDAAKNEYNNMTYDQKVKTMRWVRQHATSPAEDPEEFKRQASAYILAGSTTTDSRGAPGPSAEASQISQSYADLVAKEREEKENETRTIFDEYLRSYFSEGEGSGGKFDEVEMNQMIDAIKDGQSWLKSNPKANVQEVAQKYEEVRAICAPIIAKYGDGGDLFESKEDAGGIDHVAEDVAGGHAPLPTELQDPAELSDSSPGTSASSDPYQTPPAQASTPLLIVKKEEVDDTRQMRVAQFRDQSIKELPIYEEVKKKLCNKGFTSHEPIPRSRVLAQKLAGQLYEPLSKNWIDAQKILDHLIEIEWCDDNFVILDHEDDGDQCQMAPSV